MRIIYWENLHRIASILVVYYADDSGYYNGGCWATNSCFLLLVSAQFRIHMKIASFLLAHVIFMCKCGLYYRVSLYHSVAAVLCRQLFADAAWLIQCWVAYCVFVGFVWVFSVGRQAARHCFSAIVFSSGSSYRLIVNLIFNKYCGCCLFQRISYLFTYLSE